MSDSPKLNAYRALIVEHRTYPTDARAFVETVFRQLDEPDAEMIDAGAAEFNRAFAGGITKFLAKRLAEDIWRAMIAKARG